MTKITITGLFMNLYHDAILARDIASFSYDWWDIDHGNAPLLPSEESYEWTVQKLFGTPAVVRLIKEPSNPYDQNAIAVYLDYGDNVRKIGYVANAEETVLPGTKSANEIYDDFDTGVKATTTEIKHKEGFPFRDRIVAYFDETKTAPDYKWTTNPQVWFNPE